MSDESYCTHCGAGRTRSDHAAECPVAYRHSPNSEKPLRSTHQDRLALDCGRQIIESLRKRFPTWSAYLNQWEGEELRQEIAQIILKRI